MSFDKSGGAGGGGGNGAVPGGNDGEVQFNDAGAFAGDAGLMYDSGTQTLTSGNAVMEGDLVVKGTTTSANSEVLNIGDNHIVLNAANTMFTNESGGLVVNIGIFSPTAQDFVTTGSFVAGIDTTSNPTVETVGTAIFTANDIIQVSGTSSNDGVYEVISHTASVLTVRGIGTEATVETWTNNQFEAVTAEACTITKINVSVLLANHGGNGLWGGASGSTTSIGVPFVFDIFNDGLQFVVGINSGGTFKYSTIQSAITAAENTGQPASVIVEPGVYTETVTITKSQINLYSTGGKNEITVIDGLVTVNETTAGMGHITIQGFHLQGRCIFSGTQPTVLFLTDCFIDNSLTGTGDVISVTNPDQISGLELENCIVRDEGSGNASISLTGGDTNFIATNCLFKGSIEFKVAASQGIVTLNSCAIQPGSIDLTGSAVVCSLNSTNITSESASPCFELTSFTGAITVIGGLLDVPSTGNAVNPDSGSNLSFSNVATTAGTLLTTEMGTRLDSDGVSLLSGAGQDSDTFLNATGDYSEIPGLQFVVGKNSAGSFKYGDIQSAITAAQNTGESASVIVEPGSYTGDVTITEPQISLFSMGGKSFVTEILGLVTVNSSSPGAVTINGFDIHNRFVFSGTQRNDVVITDCIIDNLQTGTGDAISLTNSDANSILEMENCAVQLTGSGNASIARTAGDANLTATGCSIEGPIEFNLINSTGSVKLTSCDIQAGSIVLDSSLVACSINSTNITSVGTDPCFVIDDINNPATIFLVGGLMDVPGGGNVITPPVDVFNSNFSFGNVAVTPGTILDVNMGKIIDSDPSIYCSNGVLTAARKIDGFNGANLTIDIFDVNGSADSFNQATFAITTQFEMAYIKYDGNGTFLSFLLFNIGASGAVFNDFQDGKGIEYADDYSATFIDRSLTDKAYVDISRSSSTVYVKTETDLGTPGGQIILANTNIIFLNPVVFSAGTFLDIGANVTMRGTDRNIAALTANTTSPNPFIVFDTTGGSRLQLNDMTITQSGTGALLTQDIAFSVVLSDNITWEGDGSTAGSGDINLIQGQLFHATDGNLQNGGSLVIGDGTTVDGVDNIICDGTFLLTQGRVDQRCVEFTANSVVARFTGDTFTVLLGQSDTGGVGFYFHKTSSQAIFEHRGGGLRPLDATSIVFVSEDSSTCDLAVIADNTFAGAGRLYEALPLARTTDTTATLIDTRGLGFDGTNLLATADGGTPLLVQYVALTSSENDSFAPAVGTAPVDVDWYRGDMIHLDSGEGVAGIVYRHAGFTVANTDSADLDTIGSSITAPGGLTTDGTLIILADESSGLVEGWSSFFDATPVLVYSFTIPGISRLNGLTYSGINIIFADGGNSIIGVLKGSTNTIQYTIPSTASDARGVTVTSEGYAQSDGTTDLITFYDSSPVLDHSASSWQIMTNSGDSVIESSDRGGSVFTSTTEIALDPPIATSGVLVDITDRDAGTPLMFYGPSSKREKSVLSDENNGEVTITSSRNRGQTLFGSVTAKIGSAGDNQYELLVAIDGVEQEDSVGTNFFTSNGDIKTIVTQPITRDVTDDVDIRLMIRSVGNTTNLSILRSTLSHSGIG